MAEENSTDKIYLLVLNPFNKKLFYVTCSIVPHAIFLFIWRFNRITNFSFYHKCCCYGKTSPHLDTHCNEHLGKGKMGNPVKSCSSAIVKHIFSAGHNDSLYDFSILKKAQMTLTSSIIKVLTIPHHSFPFFLFNFSWFCKNSLVLLLINFIYSLLI